VNKNKSFLHQMITLPNDRKKYESLPKYNSDNNGLTLIFRKLKNFTYPFVPISHIQLY